MKEKQKSKPQKSTKKKLLKSISKEGTIFSGVACYVLSDGRRVITKRSMVSALSGGRESGDLERYIDVLPNGSGLIAPGQQIEFSLPAGGVATGIEAETIAKILRLYATAWGTGSLRANQIPVAMRAVTMLSQLAEIGIIALIDEATGYQKQRPEDALHSRLLGMIRSELADIDPIYKSLLVALARLPGSTHCDYDGTGTPPPWAPLAANICKSCGWGEEGLAKFRALNPEPSWTRRDTQHLDDDGKKLLIRVLGIAEALAFTSRNWDDWTSKMRAYFKGAPLQLWLV